VDEPTFQSISDQIDELERWVDECEQSFIYERVVREKGLRATAPVKEALHRIIERAYRRWKERNFKKRTPLA